MPPPTPPESPPRPATPREEMERRAAVRIQARARAFLAVKRYAERRRDPFFRVRGLRALIARGLEVFERDGERIAEAKRGWIESERRLAAMRFRNEDAVERIRTGVSELRRLDDTSERLRRDVAAAAERVRATLADRERFWAPIREASAKDPYRKPFPSFPSPEPSLRRAGESGARPRRCRRSIDSPTVPSTRSMRLSDFDRDRDASEAIARLRSPAGGYRYNSSRTRVVASA